MSSNTIYDLVVIGGGSGGVASARRAASHGAKVALIENNRLGGTCVIRGCVPKKLMMYAAQFGQTLREGLQPGWRIEHAQFDMATWQSAKTQEINRLEGIYAKLLANSGVEVIHGTGRVLSASQVQVGEHTLNTKRILIATGASPNRRAFPGLETAATSNELLDLTELPKRVGVIGAGYIALEFACILRGLGAEVHVFYRDDLPLRGFDNSIRNKLAEALTLQGVHLHPGTEFESLSKQGNCYALQTKTTTHGFDFVLNATGRSPNTEGLGLHNIGLKTGSKGEIEVDEFSQTDVPSVFAVGDVTNRVNLTPVAIAEGRALADNEFNGQRRTIDHGAVPTATFTSPPIGTVGLTEQAAVQRGPVRVYETEFTPMKTAFAGGKQKTYMKLLVDDASDKVVGIHMLGDDAPEMIQLLGVLYTMGATKADFDRTVAVHPSAAEEWVLLREVSRRVG
ncbi:MAG TPA: glutathione-disulfide reductase [Limnobacter sp.]|nr:glutathione-disulfide reductase [Limnobacter sp.]